MINLAKMDKRSVGKLFDYSILPKQSTEAEIRLEVEALYGSCVSILSGGSVRPASPWSTF